MVTYFMTGPDADTSRGAWRVTAVDPPTSLEFTDAFADAEGTPVPDMPSHEVTVQLAERDSGTRMEMRSKFEPREDLEELVETGMVAGLRAAVCQMDAQLGA